MGFLKNSVLAATALLALSANGHMIMKTPTPMGKSTLNNSPLAADGSDFPCKQRPGVYDTEGAQNVMAIGESQTLSFTGSAVHGGGSCQVSLTTDKEPTKQSKWMVIKSIEGGCPANTAGNLPADPNGSGASTFQFSVPQGINPGDYTLAWTWHNKVGNREMYMNCAAVTVTASKKRESISRDSLPEDSPSPPEHSPKPHFHRYARAFFARSSAPSLESSTPVVKRQASFPDMFVCNLASINDCVTPESFDYEYPNPGQDVEKAGSGPYTKLSGPGGNNPAQQPTGASPSTVSPIGGGPNPQSSSIGGFGGQSSPTAQAGGPSFATGNPNPASPSLTQGGPGVFATGSPNLVTPLDNPPKAAPTATASSPAGNSSTGSGSSSAGAQSGTCTQEGAWACSSDGTSFQRCASGSWSASIPLSQGMKCSPGISADLTMTPGKRHIHSHLRRGSFVERSH